MLRTTLRSARALAFVALAGAATVVTASAQETSVVGDWEGTITAAGQVIPMIYHISQDDEGVLSATLDTPSQGGFGIPLEDPAFVDGVFTFELSAVPGGASYVGAVGEDGSTMTGTWNQGLNEVELNMTKTESESS